MDLQIASVETSNDKERVTVPKHISCRALKGEGIRQ